MKYLNFKMDNSKKDNINIVDTYNSNLYSKTIFLTNNYNNEYIIQKDKEKLCKYCIIYTFSYITYIRV